jgi:cell division protein ftsX
MRRDKVKTAAAKKKSRREDKKNTGARALTRQRRSRQRKWLTFVRMCRYGVNNFTRNAWLTIAATAVMTITLLIIFTTVVARNILADSVTELSKKVDMSIYLKTGTTEEQAKPIMADLRKLSNVEKVEFISSDRARQQSAKDNKSDRDIQEALNQAINKMPATIRVNLHDINNTTELDRFVKESSELKKYIDSDREPSFAGSRRNAIENIGRWTDFAQRAGLAASVLFVVISSLIVFNTIRMAIFNRKDEIEMMKLIGADKSFIRGPFLVEAAVYGCIAAVLATIVCVSVFMISSDKLHSYGIVVQNTADLLKMNLLLILMGMILLGMVIGIVSAALATRRYLKL